MKAHICIVNEKYQILLNHRFIYFLKTPSNKDGSTGTVPADFFKYNAPAAKSPSFVNLREITGRHKLKPGNYFIIPSTFDPNSEGDFLLRVFTEKPVGGSG